MKDIVAELEAEYKESELLYDLEDRRRIIADFDKDMDYMFVRLKQFEEDVKFVLEHKMNVNVICRITLNLTLILQQMCKSVTDYYYAMEKYLMDERYEKNHDYWSRFIECSQRIQKLSNSLQESNIFGVEMPDEAMTIANMYYEEGNIDYTKKNSPTGTIFINEIEVEKMNGAELLICIWKLMDDFRGSLSKLKNISYSQDTSSLPDIYNRNYLLYAKNYWPAHAEHFRSHIERKRLRGRVEINGLERLRDEAAHEFEYKTPSGKIWRDYSEDIGQLGVQMKEQKLDEEQWKYFFKTIFELDEYDRWIEELRNPPESDEDKQKRERLLKTNKVFNLEPSKSKYKVDILLLYYFIKDRFITEKMFIYEWYALYYILRKVGVLTNCTTEDFVKQMNDEEWFANVDKKCSANEINTYGFLTDKSPDIWDVKFKPTGNRASKNSIDNIYRKYSDLEDTIDEIYKKE
ncbi:hypothetical protein [uncultured Prevotella sp.]|uniref:hypothetical protein n=1 Tax=uncultured Prevotella sp. TaxID=159272 RepID=UPI0025E4273D|nr:hypothetical protein [uncultured Prevotella sp.]